MTTVDQALDYREQAFINFRDHGFAKPNAHAFRWVNIKRFDLHNPPADDLLALEVLIGSTPFRDNYATEDFNPSETRHGPYWLDRISTANYRPVSALTALGTLSDWALQFGELPKDLEASLEHEVYQPLRKATGVYTLTGLDKSDFHDWGGVHGEFHEFVGIDRTAGTLALIVAADD